MLIFTRLIKQSYWKANKDSGVSDKIFVSDGFSDGTCKWEFTIRQKELMDKEISILINMYSDAVQSLKNKRVVNMLIDLKSVSTLDEAEVVLKKHKFKENINCKFVK